MNTFIRLTTAFSLLQLIAASSEKFTWVVSSPGTAVDGFNVYVNYTKTNIMLSTYADSMSGQILDDGTLVTGDDGDETMGIGRSYFSTEALSTAWIVAEPFSIVDGLLKLYGSNFHALPSGLGDGSYVLGSIDAAAGRSDVVEVSIIPQGADGNVVPDFTPGSSSSASSSTTAATTEATTETTTETTTLESSTEAAVTTETSSSIPETTEEASTTTETTAAVVYSSSNTATVISSSAVSSIVSSSAAAAASSTISTTIGSSSVSSSVEVSSTTVESSSSSAETTSEPSISTYDNGATANGISLAALVAIVAMI